MKDSKKTSKTRRDFLHQSIKASVALPFLGSLDMIPENDAVTQASLPIQKTIHPLNILILGGKSFDVRDVASWMIRLIENRTSGTYNAVGPASPMGMHAFIHGAHAAFSSPVSYVKITDYQFLKEVKVPHIIPWIMPTGGMLVLHWSITKGRLHMVCRLHHWLRRLWILMNGGILSRLLKNEEQS